MGRLRAADVIARNTQQKPSHLSGTKQRGGDRQKDDLHGRAVHGHQGPQIQLPPGEVGVDGERRDPAVDAPQLTAATDRTAAAPAPWPGRGMLP